jgi:hypothetical protein
MKTAFARLVVVPAIVAIGILMTTKASADCAGLAKIKPGATLQRQAWHGDDPIVGMWQVNFTAEGNGPNGPPDGTPIDAALVVWHADGTEIMNSGRPAQDGNFCMGIWVKTGWSSYKLNHFALGNDTENAPGGIGNPAGPTHIVEHVSLSPDGNSYHGRFVLDAFDTSGNNVAHIIGAITAKRITVDTTTVF